MWNQVRAAAAIVRRKAERPCLYTKLYISIVVCRGSLRAVIEEYMPLGGHPSH